MTESCCINCEANYDIMSAREPEEIRKERPVTAEDMSNIVVNYLAQTGPDEKAQNVVKLFTMSNNSPFMGKPI